MIARISSPIGLCLFTVLAALLVSCQAVEPFPDRDIVFQTATADRERPHRLGFVNADGSGLEYVELRPFKKGMPVFPAQTSDGAFLVFRGSHANSAFWASPVFAVTLRGRVRQYEGVFGALSVAPVPGNHQVVAVETTNGKPENIRYRIQLLDLETGIVARTYITATGLGLHVGANALCGANLAYVRRQYLEDEGRVRGEIVLLNTETQAETVLAEADALSPSISPDGRWVAYTVGDGIYVVSTSGGQSRRVVETAVRRVDYGDILWDYWPPVPSWSPDSQWLVYHRCTLPGRRWCSELSDYSVFKVNVETGEEVLLVEGALNPYWRLRVDNE